MSVANPAIEARIDELLPQLSLAEKIGQLCQEPAETPDLDALRQRIRDGHVGSLILASTPFAGSEEQICLSVAELNELQRLAVEESPRGIPLLYGRDVIHGHRTVFPVPLGQACSWDADLVRDGSQIAAREAAAHAIHWTFSPMLDIARDPRWGRCVEGYGEDPFLVAELGRAAVEGYQGTRLAGMKQDDRIVACAKHFIGYGASEGGRDYDTTEITDHTLQNVHLPPFTAAVDAGCLTVMSAFNEINGESASGSHRLLTQTLKDKLGFDGMIVSDWLSVQELVSHGLAADDSEAARIAFHAGVDLEMVSTTFRDSLAEHVKSGHISQERLDDAVRRVLRVKFAYGLFDSPYTSPEAAADLPLTDHRTLARAAVARCAVLLENQNQTLPLRPIEGKTLLTGPLLRSQGALLGTWSMDGNAADVINFETAFTEGLGAGSVVTHDPALLDQGLALARNHGSLGISRIIVFLGEDSSRSGEHHSLAEISLPPGQVDYLEALFRIGIPVIAIVTAGRPVLLERVQASADAVLFQFHGGVETGPGIWDVVSGAHSPTGRLPVSFPRSTGQIPTYHSRKRTGRPWSTAYLDESREPLYPFGYGLSYTEFAFSDLIVTRTSTHLEVSLTIKNEGEQSGHAHVQFYASDHVASLCRPGRFLCGHVWIEVPAGQSTRLNHRIPVHTLAFTTADGDFVVEPGSFTLFAGADSTCQLAADFELSCKK